MVRVLLYLFVFACLAVGAVWLADRPGEVSVLWQGYRIETSVAIAAISREAAEAAGEGWAAVEVAAAPNDDALLALTERLCNKAPAR